MRFEGAIFIALVMGLLSGASSLAIYKDTAVGFSIGGIKNSQQWAGLNELFHDNDYNDDYEEYPSSIDKESRWESAEWPQFEELSGGGGEGEDLHESEERPYNWFYHNMYIVNGLSNYLYNGPKVDMEAAFGMVGQNSPKILPRPAPSFGRSSIPEK